MLKNILKVLALAFLISTFSSAATIQDGYNELKAGNTLEAMNIFKYNCEKGAFAGCYNLGTIYYQGKYIEKNYQKAFENFEKACKEGHELACFSQAIMYENGQGTQKNLAKAIELYEKSCEKQNGSACYNLGNLYDSKMIVLMQLII